MCITRCCITCTCYYALPLRRVESSIVRYVTDSDVISLLRSDNGFVATHLEKKKKKTLNKIFRDYVLLRNVIISKIHSRLGLNRTKSRVSLSAPVRRSIERGVRRPRGCVCAANTRERLSLISEYFPRQTAVYKYYTRKPRSRAENIKHIYRRVFSP